MEDVQNRADARELAIDHVGISKLRYPITVADRVNRHQPTIAEISMGVGLPHHFKGTHMSRFLEVLNAHRTHLNLDYLRHVMADLRTVLSAETAQVEIKFPYFIERHAPVSRAAGMVCYDASFAGFMIPGAEQYILGVKVPVTSLCPCSKAISDYGAHNQRGTISVEIESAPQTFVWLEELIEYAEAAASAPVYSLVKREDERALTMQAYDHPAFVEDMARDTVVALRADQRIKWARVTVENDESIHQHNAIARIELRRPITLVEVKQ